MTRTTGSVMTVVAAIMVAGCTTDVASSARESVAAGDRQQASEPLFSPLGSAEILIFGDQTTQINALRVRLQGFGHQVTVRTGFDLPPTITELSQFQTVWHVGRGTPINSSQQNLLRQYLEIGGALHLTGEGSGSGSLNNSLQVFLRSVVENGGGITVGFTNVQPSSPFYYFDVNESAAGGVANSPHPVRTVELINAASISGGIAGTPNALISGANDVVGALWEGNRLVGGAGKLSIIMDSDWLSRLTQVNDNLELLQNLQTHMLGSPFINQPPTAVAVVPEGQNLDCEDGSGEVRELVPVQLDGSGSFDPDNAPQPLSFTWLNNFGENIATGPTPTLNLPRGEHILVLLVSDGEEDSLATVSVHITCTVACTPGSGLFNRCHPGCPCDHGEGDCDIDADCLPGLICLHDPGAAFGYEDDEVDVCSNVCPTLGVGAWNYCSPECPCDIGEGDCEIDADCLPGLRCVSDVGPAYGFQREVDICEPR